MNESALTVVDANGERIIATPRHEEPAQSPLALLDRAIQRGLDPATLKALMDLQDRHLATEARKAFVAAMNEFKAHPPNIGKNKAVDFTSAKGRTHYRHATLDHVAGIIGEGLAKVGISFGWDTQQTDGGLVKVTCILTHALGHSESVWLQAKPDESGNKNSIQAVGSTVTYLQRYTLLAVTGMAVQDQDDDGRHGKAGLTEGAIADWKAAIEALTTIEESDAFWRKIATATTTAGDVPAHEELKAAMAAKRKALKGAK